MVSQSTQLNILTAAILFNSFITAAGVVYGWQGLQQQLKNEGEFAQDCPAPYDPKGTCTSQDDRMSLIYTVGGNIATNVGTVIFGFSVDKFGVRSNAVSGALLMMTGFLLLAFSTTLGEHPMNAFVPAFGFIGFGGLGGYLASFQFSVLYKRPMLLLSALSALFGAAGTTFTFLNLLDEHEGVSRKASCIGYAILLAFCALNQAVLYPKRAYKPGDAVHLPLLGWLGLATDPNASGLASQGLNGDVPAYAALDDAMPQRSASNLQIYSNDVESPILTDGTNGLPTADGTQVNGPLTKLSSVELAFLKQESLVRDLTPEEKEAVKNSRSLREELLNWGTVLVALHFSVGLLACNLYNANISTVLTHKGDDDKKYTNAFVFIASLWPILFSLAIDPLQRRLRYAGTSALALVLMAISFAFLFFHNLPVQVPGFIIFAAGRALLITVMFSFAALEYRRDHYGRVVAFIVTICALIGLLQLALQKVLTGPANNDFDYFATGMIVACAPLLAFSYWCYKNRV